jgi:hypothetical protein
MGMTLTVPIVLFAIAAGGGLLLATLRFKDRELPMPVALLHGALAAGGLLTLILIVVKHGGGSLVRVALGLFVIAALGGFFLFSFHVRGKKLPLGVVGVHGAAAVVAFVLLLIGVLGH